MMNLVRSMVARHKMVKVFFTINVELVQLGDDGESIVRSEAFSFRGHAIHGKPFLEMEAGGDLYDRVALALGDMERNLDEFVFQGSGWVISRPLFMDAEVVEVRPLNGGGKCNLHIAQFLRNRGVSINNSRGIDKKADDGYCLYKAVAAHLVDTQARKLSHITDVSPDEKEAFFDSVLARLMDPAGQKRKPSPNVQLKKIAMLEDDWEGYLKLDIAVHVIFCDEDKVLVPLHTSSRSSAEINVVLVLFHTTNGSHYALVQNPSKLFAYRLTADSDGLQRSYRKHICYKCFNFFHTKSALDQHKVFCHEPDGQRIQMPAAGSKMCFNDENELKRSVTFQSGYVLVFDFETLQIDAPSPCSCPAEIRENTNSEQAKREWFNSLSKDEQINYLCEISMEEGLEEQIRAQEDADNVPKTKRRKFNKPRPPKLCPHKQKILKEQHAFAYSYVLMTRDGKVVESHAYYGEDAAEHFIGTVLDLADKYLPKLSPGKPMEDLGAKKIKSIRRNARKCYICKDPLLGDRVMDHDHVTGKFLGVAHNFCNLMRKEVPRITCFSHNLSGYDSHLLIPKLHKFGKRINNLRAIALNTQKFKTFNFNKKIYFLDSLAFLPDSLDKLVENLNASGSKFSLLNNLLFDGGESDDAAADGGVRELPPEMKKLLLRKGVYPYSFATSIEALENCQELPPREEFFNDLNQQEVSDEDYTHAQNVWKTFGCKNMLEYTTLYVKTDVLLLAEAIHDMRSNIWDEFGLDMCAYLSLPMLAKDIMLKYTDAEIELITDQEMSNMIQSNIRGGLSFINKRVAVSKPGEGEDSKVILYVDANNLYGRAMVFPLPYRGFRWMTQSELDDFDLDKDVTRVSGDQGYILEVDLEYPEHLHLEHNSFPLAPHSMNIDETDISQYSKEALQAIYEKNKHKSKKLVSTFKTR